MVGKYFLVVFKKKYLCRYLQTSKIGSIPILSTKKLLTIIVNIKDILVVFKMPSKKGITYKKYKHLSFK